MVPTRLMLAVAFAAANFLAVAQAEVSHASTDGFTSKHTATLSADEMTTWVALTQDVGKWWLDDHTWFGDASNLSIELRAGGCFCERNDSAESMHLMVSHVQPPKTLRLLGGLGPLQGLGLYGALEWNISTLDAQTQLNLTYRVGGYSEMDLTQLAPIVDGVLQQQFESLVSYINTLETQ